MFVEQRLDLPWSANYRNTPPSRFNKLKILSFTPHFLDRVRTRRIIFRIASLEEDNTVGGTLLNIVKENQQTHTHKKLVVVDNNKA